MSAQPGTLEGITSFESRRFALNLAANVGNLGLTMLVGAFYVPFLVRKLGPGAYGLIPLTSMVTSYMALITCGLDSAVSRSLTMALERKDHDKANLIFNVALWGNVALAALLVIPGVIAITQVQHILRIPPGYETATRWLFGGTIAAFLLNQIKTPFGVSSFCRNRLDLQNLVAAGETFTRIGLVVFLFFAVGPKIEFIGAAILAGTIVSTVGVIRLWKLLTPTLRISLRHFDWKMLNKLCGTGGWVIVSQLGVMLYLNIDLLVANRLFGPELSGSYAAVLQLPALLRLLAGAIGGILPPTIYYFYARGDTNGLVMYLNRAIKFLGLLMALSIGLLCGFSEPLLRLWLGPSFSHLAPLLFLMAIHLCINLSMYPLYTVPLAADRVKVPGLVTVAIGVGNLLLALLLAGVFGWGLYGLAAAGGITLTVRHLLFTPLYAARVLNQPYRTFFRGILPTVFATLATIALCRLILWRFAILNWVELGIAASAVALLFISLVSLFLSPEERLAISEMVIRRQKKADSRTGFPLNWRKPAYLSYASLRGYRFPRILSEYLRGYERGVNGETAVSALRQLLQHCRSVPYYAELLKDIRDGELEADPRACLQRLPILTKETIRANFSRLKSADLSRRKWHENTSGGSTGEAVRLLQDAEYDDRSTALRLFFNHTLGCEVGDPIVRIWGSERDLDGRTKSPKARFFNWLTNTTWMNAFLMSPERMRVFIDTLNQLRPRLIVAYAQAAYELAQFAEREGLSVAPQRAVLTSAGTLYPFMREKIATVFGCEVYNLYGSREVSDIACELPGVKGLWVAPWANFVEIVDEAGRSVQPGVEGNIVVTSLNNYAMPLVRYAIGDRGTLLPDDGIGNQVLKHVSGRNVDVFRRRDQTLIDGEYFTHLLYFRPWVCKFQVVQKAHQHVVFKLVRANGEPPTSELAEIAAKTRIVMGEDCRVDFEFARDLPPHPSGKYRYTISEVGA